MPMRTMPEKVDSKFRFVLVSARRAEQLMRGARPHFQSTLKPTRVAQQEVMQGLVQWEYGVEQPEEAAPAVAQPVEEPAAEEVH